MSWRNAFGLRVGMALAVLAASAALVRAEVRTTSAGTFYVSRPAGAANAPLLVFLHGQGGDEDQGRQIFEGLASQRGYALLCPRGPSPQKSWYLNGGVEVRAMIEEVCGGGGVDKARILMVGYSAGGSTSYDYALSNADLVAALAPVNCGLAGQPPMGRKLPVYIVDCTGDPNYQAARQAEQYLKSAGFNVTFDEIPGGSHAYPSEASSRILDWFERTVPAKPGTPGTPTPTPGPTATPPGTPTPIPGPSGTPTPAPGATPVPPGAPGTPADPGATPAASATPSGTPADGGGTSANNDGTSADSGDAGQTPTPPPLPTPLPVVNSYGIDVGGLTDGEISSLIQEWFTTVYRPGQKPPDDGAGWSMDEWGVWVAGNVEHTGGIDGYGSPVQYWIKTSEQCRSFVREQGRTLHPPPGAPGAAPEPGASATGRPTALPEASPSASPTGSSAAAAAAGGTKGSEPVPDLTRGDNGGLGSGAAAPSALVQARPYDLYVPAEFDVAASASWGLVVGVSCIAGNTAYFKSKWSSACSSGKCLFVGVKAKNPTGDPLGFRWERDEAENVQYLRDVVKDVEGRYGLAAGRTYAAGFSNGAYFLGQVGDRLDDLFEGYSMCEGGQFLGSSDGQILISGKSELQGGRTGNRWSAWCKGMGHFLPGPPAPAYGDPGVSTTADGLAVDAAAQLEWLSK